MSIIYPVGGGKGGVGKSLIAANLGVIFAKQGKKVVLVDLDLGGANLHTLLGHSENKKGLHNFLGKTAAKLEHVAEPTKIPNLFIIDSSDCSIEITNLFHAQKLKIIKAIQKLPYDIIILDLGAGTSFNILDFFLSSTQGVLVCTPEPISIENTFRFIQAVYYRKLKQILQKKEFNSIVAEIVKDSGNKIIKSSKIIDFVAKKDRAKGDLLQKKLREFDFMIILNRFRKLMDESVGNKIEKVCCRHFYSTFQYLGKINYDERIYDSVVTRTAFMNKYPYTLSASDFQNIANKIMAYEQQPSHLSSKIS